MVEKVSALLDQQEYLEDLNERLAGLAEAYDLDKELMRCHFYRPDKVSVQFQKFGASGSTISGKRRLYVGRASCFYYAG